MNSQIIQNFRQQIDKIDDELLDLISKRMAIAKEIGKHKKLNSIPISQPDRESELLEVMRAKAVALNLNPEFIERIIKQLLEESKRIQAAC